MLHSVLGPNVRFVYAMDEVLIDCDDHWLFDYCVHGESDRKLPGVSKDRYILFLCSKPCHFVKAKQRDLSASSGMHLNYPSVPCVDPKFAGWVPMRVLQFLETGRS